MYTKASKNQYWQPVKSGSLIFAVKTNHLDQLLEEIILEEILMTIGINEFLNCCEILV